MHTIALACAETRLVGRPPPLQRPRAVTHAAPAARVPQGRGALDGHSPGGLAVAAAARRDAGPGPVSGHDAAGRRGPARQPRIEPEVDPGCGTVGRAPQGRELRCKLVELVLGHLCESGLGSCVESCLLHLRLGSLKLMLHLHTKHEHREISGPSSPVSSIARSFSSCHAGGSDFRPTPHFEIPVRKCCCPFGGKFEKQGKTRNVVAEGARERHLQVCLAAPCWQEWCSLTSKS